MQEIVRQSVDARTFQVTVEEFNLSMILFIQRVGSSVVISWPYPANGYNLERAAGLGSLDVHVDSPFDHPVVPAEQAFHLPMVAAGRRRLEEIKRFDMPGFRPRPEYIREMKRYGVLPTSFDAARDSIDVYDMDRRYWDLFGWKTASDMERPRH